MYFEVKYTKTPGIPRCPYHYHCEGCGNKYQAVRNGKGREKCLKAGKVGTKEVYLLYRPQRYLCKKTGKSFTDDRINYRWKRITRAKMRDILKDIGNMSISKTAKTHGVSVNIVEEMNCQGDLPLLEPGGGNLSFTNASKPMLRVKS